MKLFKIVLPDKRNLTISFINLNVVLQLVVDNQSLAYRLSPINSCKLQLLQLEIDKMEAVRLVKRASTVT